MQRRCFVGKPKYHDMIFLPYLPPLLCIQHVFLCSLHCKQFFFSLSFQVRLDHLEFVLFSDLLFQADLTLCWMIFLSIGCVVTVVFHLCQMQMSASKTKAAQSSRRCILLSAEKWYCVLLCVRIPTYCLSHSGSSQKLEMDELGPGQAVYYTWAEPTGSRVLCWSWGPYSGELKNEEVRTHLNT